MVRGCIAATALAACAAGTELPPNDGLLALGTWGGDTSGMIVSDTAMHLHVGCTYGDVSGRIPINASGDFDVGGSYLLRAFPVAVGPTMPARFVGHRNGNSMTVTVTVTDTVEHTTVVRGPVTVRFGDAPQMGPCPICRRPIITRTRAMQYMQ
jgi:hypothetical protein